MQTNLMSYWKVYHSIWLLIQRRIDYQDHINIFVDSKFYFSILVKNIRTLTSSALSFFSSSTSFSKDKFFLSASLRFLCVSESTAESCLLSSSWHWLCTWKKHLKTVFDNNYVYILSIPEFRLELLEILEFVHLDHSFPVIIFHIYIPNLIGSFSHYFL